MVQREEQKTGALLELVRIKVSVIKVWSHQKVGTRNNSARIRKMFENTC